MIVFFITPALLARSRCASSKRFEKTNMKKTDEKKLTAESPVMKAIAELEVSPTPKFQREFLSEKTAFIDACFIAYCSSGRPPCKAWREAHEAWAYRAQMLKASPA